MALIEIGVMENSYHVDRKTQTFPTIYPGSAAVLSQTSEQSRSQKWRTDRKAWEMHKCITMLWGILLLEKIGIVVKSMELNALSPH